MCSLLSDTVKNQLENNAATTQDISYIVLIAKTKACKGCGQAEFQQIKAD